ncbi:hypothetical protein AMTRI_Chr12g234040 [Amborella trichopoda]
MGEGEVCRDRREHPYLYLDRFDFYGDRQYELPSSFYDFGSLLVLNLHNCSMAVPLESKVFRSLKTLCLYSVDINDDQLSVLLSKCEVLQNLTLHRCGDVENIKILVLQNLTLHKCRIIERIKILGHTQLRSLKIDGCTTELGRLEIHAPNLLSFDFTVWAFGSPVLNVPRLLKVSITPCFSYLEKYGCEMAMNLTTLVHVNSLSLLGFFLQVNYCTCLFFEGILMNLWSNGPCAYKLPKSQELALKVNMAKLSWVTTMAHFLGCCHHLEEIVFWLDQHNPEGWLNRDPKVPTYCIGDCLRTVVIRNFSGLEEEEAFHEFREKDAKALENLAKVERASQNVEMVIDFDSIHEPYDHIFYKPIYYLHDSDYDSDYDDYIYDYYYDCDFGDGYFEYDTFEIKGYFYDHKMILNLMLH